MSTQYADRIAKALHVVKNTMADEVFENVIDQVALAFCDLDPSGTPSRGFDYQRFYDRCVGQ